VVERNQAQEDRLMSDPTRQRNTFRKNDKEKATPGTHSYGCVVGGGTVTYGGSSWRHLPYEFNELTRTRRFHPAPAWPTGRSRTKRLSRTTCRPSGKWGCRAAREFAVRGADVEDYPVPPVPLKASGACSTSPPRRWG
jgi:hypothetical protein